MGVSVAARTDMLVSLKDANMVQGYGSLWKKVLEAEAKRSCRMKKKVFRKIKGGDMMRRTSPRRVWMKRRRAGAAIERRVRTLKKLIPNSRESMGLDGLFGETAVYIVFLQASVKMMQTMVDALTDSSE